MKSIKMVDLEGQYLQVKQEIDAAIQEVIVTSAFIKGPAVKEFEKNLQSYLDVNHTIACGNGTDALQVALMALDLKPGDEVITTSFTFIATVEVIALLGLTPVFVDIQPGTFNMDVEQVKNAITGRTKVILPVHLFGQCSDMEPLMELANENDIHIIEDNAQAIGADYNFSNGVKKKAGTLGTLGCTSFFPSKNLGGYGDGGAIFTNDSHLAEKISAIVNHGMRKKYHHEYIGVNSRLDTIQAAILNVKLKYLDQYIKARQKAAIYYDQIFMNHPGIKIPVRSGNSTHVFHQYTLQVPANKRDGLQEFLKTKNIPSMIYYPVPLHLQKAYAFLGYKEGDLPVTEQMSKVVLSLPMHTELDDEQLNYISKNVIEYLDAKS